MSGSLPEEPVAAGPEPGSDQPPDPPSRSRRDLAWLLEIGMLAAITVVALLVRFRGIQWGTGYYLHPDELFMTSVLVNISAPSGFFEYLSSATSPLNPFNHGTGYIYGTFPLFAAKLVGSFTDYTAISNAQIPGRWLSAIADTGTVVLVWWIGRMLWNWWTGLLAALLMAFTALNIGAAHYFTTDAWSAFFATASFAFVLAAWKYRRWVFYALAGIMVGLAASSKPNLLAAFGFLLLPALEAIRLHGWRGLWPKWSKLDEEDDQRTFPVLLASALALFVAVWTIRLAQPYMFEGPSLFSFRLDSRWLADVEYWRNAQSGAMDYYPGHQWAERTPIVFQLRNMILWGMGPGLGIAALGGLAWNLWRMLAARRWPSWITLGVVGWISFHIVYFGIGFVKTQRYLLPAYPFLVLLAAAAITATVGWAWRNDRIRLPRMSWSIRFPKWCHPGFVLPVVAIAVTVLYGTAYTSIYANTQTRAAASEWIVENVPDGSTLANEYWDLGLPVGIPELAGHSYVGINLHLYADENPGKLTELIGMLQRTDYIILSSGRLRDSITRMPWRYPMATRYYEALYSGELGFDQVAQFTSFPELFGVEIDDRSAEETLTVYDHPEVTIFRKTDRWDHHAAWNLLNEALGHGGLYILPAQTQPNDMTLDAADQQLLSASSTWSSIFDPGSISNTLPVVFWYIALQIIALPMIPIMWRLAPWLPDRGYAISKTVGIFCVSWIAWWLSTLRLLEFGLWPIALAWLAVFAVAVLLMRSNAVRMEQDFRRAWRWVVTTEVLFLASYAGTIWVRSQNPDLWTPTRIGSQLQDMATFNAMVLTPFFPAYDPWLSDGTIHDFTFGFMPWAVLTRITAIAPETAYSLSLATLVTLVIVNAWMASCVLVARFRHHGREWGTILGGLLAPVLLLGIGSWGMAQRVGSSDWGLNYEGTVPDAIAGLWTTITSNPALPPGAWHSTDRFVGPGLLEFPLLGYLTGELGIHQLGMPLFLVGVVLLLGFLTRVDPPLARDRRIMETLGGWRTATGFLLAMGLVLGWTLATNPLMGAAVIGLAAVMTLLTVGAHTMWRSSWVILRDSGVAIGIVSIIALVAVAPVFSSYGTLATRRIPLTQSISLNDFIGHMGVLFVIAVGYAVWQIWSMVAFSREPAGLGWPIVVGFALLSVLAFAFAFIIGSVTIFLLVLILFLGCLVWYHHDEVRHLAVLAAITLACVLGIVANRMAFATWTERQNIPLQFSLVSWMLLAVVSASVLVLAFETGWRRSSLLRMAGRRTTSLVLAIALAVLVGASAVYPVLGIPQQVDDRLGETRTTADSYAFMENGQLALNAQNVPVAPYDLSGDLAAIEWMRNNLVGLPLIMEAPGGNPGWAGRVSALTGYPTVVGVTSVQLQQRPGMDRLVNWRYADVTEAFGSEAPFSEIEPILRDYGVRIIYVGPLERATYSAVALSKFDVAAESGELQVLYRSEDVTLYFYGGPRESREPHDP